MQNIILIDFEPSEIWNFDKLLEKETNENWIVVKQVSNLNQGSKLQTLIRYLKYFWLPLNVLIKNKSVNKIVAWQQFYGIIYAFYVHLLKKRTYAELYIMTFIYKKKHGRIGRIYEKFIKYSLESECIKKVFVFSDSEPDYYSKELGVDKTIFKTISLGVEDYNNNGICNTSNKKFYLSVGRSNRDYEFLIQTWNDSYGNLKIITDMPIESEYDHSKIEIIRGCYEQDYYNLLKQSYAVIIPLKDENISSGELVSIQAGMFGKPIIATFNTTLEKYITNGLNGFICNKNSLYYYIDKINNPELYAKMCTTSRRRYEERYSLENMAKEIAEYLC